MSREVIQELDSIVSGKSLLKHSFYQAWTAGRLPLERLRSYAVRYYPHVAAFPRYLSALHSRCEDIATRQSLLENLVEEERGAENHPELWLRFAEALGASRKEVLSASPVAAATSLVCVYRDLTNNAPIAAGLAALYAYESQIPAVAAAKIEGLRRFYEFENDRGLEFFQVHERADVDHARTGAELIERHCASSADATAVIDSANRALDALWWMLDAM
jgi:pyrroloquinoline-quinone synthase